MLGGFEAQFQSGAPVPPLGRKAQALLAILALAPGVPQPREKLAALLWSDRGEAQARSSLRQALSELRKALAGADPPPLETTGEAVTLAAHAVVVDVEVFGRLVDGGERPSLESAVELYRGDFLDGFAVPDPAFEDWLRDVRRQTRDRVVAAFTRLLELQRADGEADAALATARRLLALDPLQESAHRAIMRLHAERGERTLALKQYRACRELLQKELGVEPDRVTERLHEEIKREDRTEGRSSAEPALPVKPAIAVLPFDNLSDDPEQAYFADGMTRALITELGRLPNLAVVAAASTFAYEGRRVTVAEVSRDLGARYVVEGGIQKSGRRFRVTAQMTDAETGRQIWGDRFDGDLGDIFEIQDELTKQICGHLYLPLLEHRFVQARQKPTASADGYDLYMRALYQVERPTRSGTQEALAACRRILEIDPNFAPVYEALMWFHIHEAWNGWVEDPDPALQAARRELERGVALATTDAYLRGSLGFIEVLQGEFERGLENLRSAVDQIPGDPAYRALYGGALSFAGRTDEAFAVLAETERLSPGYHVTRLFQGDVHFAVGRPAEAAPFFEQFLNVLPDFGYARLYLAACRVELGQMDSARETVAKIAAASSGMTAGYVRKLLRARDPALVDRLLAALETAGLPA
ncbi:MAG: BTAD domain-containing putative transcriptional regulator [Kiloniellales bacterium]|nr:BTAD domain-containing putative transcriptional regulator [Kiloniellales bacterium]